MVAIVQRRRGGESGNMVRRGGGRDGDCLRYCNYYRASPSPSWKTTPVLVLLYVLGIILFATAFIDGLLLLSAPKKPPTDALRIGRMRPRQEQQQHSRRHLIHLYHYRQPQAVASTSPSSVSSTAIYLDKKWFNEENDKNENDDGDPNLMPIVRKQRNKQRKDVGRKRPPHDDRDRLPFSVRTTSPDDPYKSRYLKEREKQRLQKKNRDNDKSSTNTTPFRLIRRKNARSSTGSSGRNSSNKRSANSSSTIIGEYQLDPTTTSGDVISIGTIEYKVEKARCQYRYAGSGKFNMVRKILEVKELTRHQTEESLTRQYRRSQSTLNNNIPGTLE